MQPALESLNERNKVMACDARTWRRAACAPQVRQAANANGEREARALAALERGSAQHGAALEQRLRALGEREGAVAARERQLEELKVRGLFWGAQVADPCCCCCCCCCCC
jgi:hypothetical protein